MVASVLIINLSGPGHTTYRLESLTDGSVRVRYMAQVSGNYQMRVGVRTTKGSARIAPLPGSPFTIVVVPADSLSPRRRSAHTSTAGVDGVGKADDALPSYLTARASTVRAEDVRLRVPRGQLAHAVAGMASRIEIVAPALGGNRVELPGRMKCVLHLQSAWCHGGDVGSSQQASPSKREAADPEASWPRGGRERYFKGRVAFAPDHVQPPVEVPVAGFDMAFASLPFAGDVASTTCGLLSHEREASDALQALAGRGVDNVGRLGGALLWASYTVSRAGMYLVHVTVDKQHVVGSPLTLRVAPASACASRCEMLGSAQAEAEAGRLETCTVWLRDAYGNKRRHDDMPAAGSLAATLEMLSAHRRLPEAPVEHEDEYHGSHVSGWAAQSDAWSAYRSGGGKNAGVIEAAAASVSVNELPDGSYAVGYTIRHAGVWALSVTLDGEPICRSPFAVSVWPAGLHPLACDVTGYNLWLNPLGLCEPSMSRDLDCLPAGSDYALLL